MWNTIYKIISDALYSLTILQGTVERILNGKRSKKDSLYALTEISKVAKHLCSVYMALRIYNGKAREKMVVFDKWDDSERLVGNKISIREHALVEGPFIPVVEKVYNVMDNLIANGYVNKLCRAQRAFGMYHVGVRIYAGKVMVGMLAVSPEKTYEYISRIAGQFEEGISIEIGQRHVKVGVKKDTKKGELHIVTHLNFRDNDYPVLDQRSSEASGN